MSWEIVVRRHLVPEGRAASWPDQVVDFKRDGRLVAVVYAVESEPGIQIASQVLDFSQAVLGMPDGEGGQIVTRVELRAEGEPTAIAARGGPWLAFVLREGAS